MLLQVAWRVPSENVQIVNTNPNKVYIFWKLIEYRF